MANQAKSTISFWGHTSKKFLGSFPRFKGKYNGYVCHHPSHGKQNEPVFQEIL